jgi:hypothetical protein
MGYTMNAELKSSIVFTCNSATHEDLTKLAAAIEYRREDLVKKAKNSLREGQAVTFSSNGVDYGGVIFAMLRRNAVVECPLDGPYDPLYSRELPYPIWVSSYSDRVGEADPTHVRYGVPMEMLEAA